MTEKMPTAVRVAFLAFIEAEEILHRDACWPSFLAGWNARDGDGCAWCNAHEADLADLLEEYRAAVRDWNPTDPEKSTELGRAEHSIHAAFARLRAQAQARALEYLHTTSAYLSMIEGHAELLEIMPSDKATMRVQRIRAAAKALRDERERFRAALAAPPSQEEGP